MSYQNAFSPLDILFRDLLIFVLFRNFHTIYPLNVSIDLRIRAKNAISSEYHKRGAREGQTPVMYVVRCIKFQ